jgi:hypothetical protein
LGNITGIVNSNSNLNLKIYPNPTSDYLEVENLTADSDFEIINAAGQKVKIGKLKPTERLVINELATESYFLLLKQLDNALKFRKLQTLKVVLTSIETKVMLVLKFEGFRFYNKKSSVVAGFFYCNDTKRKY